MSNALNLGSVTLPGSGYLSLFGLTIPVTAGLEGAFLLGDGVESCVKNYAEGKADATIIGAPVDGGTYTKFGGGAYIDTGITETAAQTLIAVGRVGTAVPASTAAHFLSSLSSPGSGSRLFQASKTAINVNAAKNNAADSIGLLRANDDTMHVVSARTSSSSLLVLNDKTLSTAATSAVTGLARTVSARKFEIGSSPVAVSTEMLIAMVYSRVLTDTELDSVVVWARSYAKSKGFSV